jgi:hypothetical protein
LHLESKHRRDEGGAIVRCAFRESLIARSIRSRACVAFGTPVTRLECREGEGLELKSGAHTTELEVTSEQVAVGEFSLQTD